MGPRLGVAYALNSKTTIRAGAARSFSRVTVVASSSHYAGFIGQYTFASHQPGITPAFYWDQGLAVLSAAAADQSGVREQRERGLLAGQEATRAPVNDNWTFSIQRQLSQARSSKRITTASWARTCKAGL